jgi:hypothetical protein
MYSQYNRNFFWELHAKDVFRESGIYRNQNTRKAPVQFTAILKKRVLHPAD